MPVKSITFSSETPKDASNRDTKNMAFFSNWFMRYAMVVISIVAAYLLRQSLMHFIGGDMPPFATFFPIVMISSLLWGFGAGLLATALAACISAYWTFPPVGMQIGLAMDIISLLMFICMGILMSVIALLYKRNRLSVVNLMTEHAIDLEEKNQRLRQEILERENAEREKLEVETELAQAQRIDAIDRFAGGIAHDLNNILSPIIINTEELLAEEPIDSIRHGILDQTLKVAYRQRDLVKKILSFSRRSERTLKNIQVKPLLEETVNFLTSTIPSTIQIHQNIDVKSDTIIGDPIQIQQVIINLCQNAADALDSKKGTIEIGLTNASVDSKNVTQGIKAGDYLGLTVKDTGHGMKPSVKDHIFEPFFTTKDVGKGTGLGLSVVYGIIKSHGGTITVESEEGKGSLFTVYLPMSDAEYQVQSSDDDNVPSIQGKERILLVDDEEFILSSLQRTLRQSGYRVTALKNGMEALIVFNEKSDEFDLVITDLTMPGMTGLELSSKLQDVRPGVPIILCTGYNDVISRQEAKSYGIKELVLKPTGTGELRKVVRRILENCHS